MISRVHDVQLLLQLPQQQQLVQLAVAVVAGTDENADDVSNGCKSNAVVGSNNVFDKDSSNAFFREVVDKLRPMAMATTKTTAAAMQ